MGRLITSQKNTTYTIEGYLDDRPYSDAASCILGEMISVILGEVSNSVFPIEMYFVKPNRTTYILETKSVSNEPLSLDGLFFSGEKKEYFDKRVNLLHDCVRIKKYNQRWNKARLILPNQKKYTFEYKFDRDVHWLYSVPSDHPVLDALAHDVLKKIASWDGLGADHSRPWMNLFF